MTGTPCTLYLSWPPGHFSLNCPCPACMYTVPFLTSRSLQPELSLSCMTGTPCTLSRSLQPELSLSCMTDTPCPLYLYVCILACLCRVQAYINFVWSSQACICKYLMVQLITNKFYMKQCFSRSHTQLSKLKQWNNHQQWFTIYNVRSMSTSWFYTANDQAVQTNASQMIQRE